VSLKFVVLLISLLFQISFEIIGGGDFRLGEARTFPEFEGWRFVEAELCVFRRRPPIA
jgi:hypothetical protein